MTRPTPHAARRLLFGLNLGLAVLLVTLGVTTAVGGGSAEAAADAPLAMDALRMAWETERQTGLHWAPSSPVSPKEADAVFGRYAGRTPAHWPFVGPLPPEPSLAGALPRPGEPEAPTDLAALGSVRMLTVGEGIPVLSFTLRQAPRVMVHVTPGEFIRRSDDVPARFRLTRIERISTQVHHIHYEVLDGDVVERTAVLIHDTRRELPARGPFRVEAKADGSTAAAAPAAGAVTAEKPKPSSTVLAADAPRALTPSAFRPVIHTNPNNARDRVIEFDARTHRWGKANGVEALLKQLKTTPATDATTGQALGIRIAGFGEGLKADAFDVRKGDILVRVAGQQVANRADLLAIAKTLDPAQLVPIVVDRRGTLHTYRVDARDPHTKRKLPYFENLK